MRKIEVKFNDTEYTVAPSFAVIERIEQRFDLMSFLRSIQMAKTRTRDVAWVLFCALAEAGYKESYADIGQMVLDDLETTTVAAAELVSSALGAGPEEAPAKKPKSTKAEGA